MRFFQKFFRYLPFSWKCWMVDFILKRQEIEIKIAETPAELDQVYRLRFEVYKNEDYIDPADYPDEKMRDGYDNYSINFLALRNNNPVGTVRLIQYSHLGFPTEKAFNIIEFPFNFLRKETVNLSKLCVKEKFRNGIVSAGLFKEAFEYSKKEGIKYWIFDTTQDLVHCFEDRLRISLSHLPVGPPGPKQFEERATIAKKYFKRFQLTPYLLNLERVKRY